tara:strand:- start:2302 stop:2472 length:171 start_codon:yes stop_codon:yes gene_type:complete
MDSLIVQIDEAIKEANASSQKKMVQRLELIKNYIVGYNDALWGFSTKMEGENNGED